MPGSETSVSDTRQTHQSQDTPPARTAQTKWKWLAILLTCLLLGGFAGYLYGNHVGGQSTDKIVASRLDSIRSDLEYFGPRDKTVMGCNDAQRAFIRDSQSWNRNGSFGFNSSPELADQARIPGTSFRMRFIQESATTSCAFVLLVNPESTVWLPNLDASLPTKDGTYKMTGNSGGSVNDAGKFTCVMKAPPTVTPGKNGSSTVVAGKCDRLSVG